MIYPQSLSAFGQTKKAGTTGFRHCRLGSSTDEPQSFPLLRAGECLPRIENKIASGCRRKWADFSRRRYKQTRKTPHRSSLLFFQQGQRIPQRVQCETYRSQADGAQPALPRRGGNAQRINYKRIVPQYIVFVNPSSAYFVSVKIFSKIFLLMQKNYVNIPIYYVEPS